jgi:hypothetical protein
MAKDWKFPQDSKTDKSGYMEHQGRAPERGEFNDQQLADNLGIGVQNAHQRIEDVTEHRTSDLGDDD